MCCFLSFSVTIVVLIVVFFYFISLARTFFFVIIYRYLVACIHTRVISRPDNWRRRAVTRTSDYIATQFFRMTFYYFSLTTIPRRGIFKPIHKNILPTTKLDSGWHIDVYTYICVYTYIILCSTRTRVGAACLSTIMYI